MTTLPILNREFRVSLVQFNSQSSWRSWISVQAQQTIQKWNKRQRTYFMLVFRSIGHSTPVVWLLLKRIHQNPSTNPSPC